LNEEYIYDKQGRLENPGFLDYRVPVAPDVPMINTVMVENANPRHPSAPARRRGADRAADGGRRQCINDAIGIRMRDLPMSPARLRAAIDANELRARGIAGCIGSAERAARRHLGPGCRRFTRADRIRGGGNNFRRMVLELDRAFPARRQIEESMAVAIDGEIFQTPTSLRSTRERDLPDPKIGGG